MLDIIFASTVVICGNPYPVRTKNQDSTILNRDCAACQLSSALQSSLRACRQKVEGHR